MGRDAGFLAQNSAIAAGAEAAIIPEDSTGADQLELFIGHGIRKSKKSCIVLVSESPKCGAMYYADRAHTSISSSVVAINGIAPCIGKSFPPSRGKILPFARNAQ